MELDIKLKDAFFDRPAIQAALSKTRRRVLSKAGAFVRKGARSSIRRRKKASAPGTPPSAHASKKKTGTDGLKMILFAYDTQRDSVIVGPVKLNQKNDGVPVPQLHEFGGTIVITEFRYVHPRFTTNWLRSSKKRANSLAKISGATLETRTRVANYPARPFMRPALEREAPKFPDLFRDAIKKTTA